MTQPSIEPALMAYLTAQDQRRARRAATALAAMTGHERALVREAAVMGFTQGMINAQADRLRPPNDSIIALTVISHCQDDPDLYPTIAALTNPPEPPPETP